MVQTQKSFAFVVKSTHHVFGTRKIGLNDFERSRNAPGKMQIVFVEAYGGCRGPAAVSSVLVWLVVPPARPAPRAVTCSGTAEGMEMNGPAAAVPGHVQWALLSFLVVTLKPLPA